ncbi:MAG: helix-turn-helix transcriptional regulator [Clostridia bacterium]|nr:helix-turn-helix transcriptional regulator [Clostridia bacterium]
MFTSFKPLFKMLIDRNMKKKDLAALSGVSIATITKMRKDGVSVSSDVLARISHALGCKIDDIIEILPGVPKKTPTL